MLNLRHLTAEGILSPTSRSKELSEKIEKLKKALEVKKRREAQAAGECVLVCVCARCERVSSTGGYMAQMSVRLWHQATVFYDELCG
jgi:hypothetical protein